MSSSRSSTTPLLCDPRPQRDVPGFEGALTCCSDWPQKKKGVPPNAQSTIFNPLIACVIGPIEGYYTAEQLAFAFEWWTAALPAWPRWVQSLREAGAMSWRDRLIKYAKGNPNPLIHKAKKGDNVGSIPHFKGKMQGDVLELAPMIAVEVYACVACLYSTAALDNTEAINQKDKKESLTLSEESSEKASEKLNGGGINYSDNDNNGSLQSRCIAHINRCDRHEFSSSDEFTDFTHEVCSAWIEHVRIEFPSAADGSGSIPAAEWLAWLQQTSASSSSSSSKRCVVDLSHLYSITDCTEDNRETKEKDGEDDTEDVKGRRREFLSLSHCLYYLLRSSPTNRDVLLKAHTPHVIGVFIACAQTLRRMLEDSVVAWSDFMLLSTPSAESTLRNEHNGTLCSHTHFSLSALLAVLQICRYDDNQDGNDTDNDIINFKEGPAWSVKMCEDLGLDLLMRSRSNGSNGSAGSNSADRAMDGMSVNRVNIRKEGIAITLLLQTSKRLSKAPPHPTSPISQYARALSSNGLVSSCLNILRKLSYLSKTLLPATSNATIIATGDSGSGSNEGSHDNGEIVSLWTLCQIVQVAALECIYGLALSPPTRNLNTGKSGIRDVGAETLASYEFSGGASVLGALVNITHAADASGSDSYAYTSGVYTQILQFGCAYVALCLNRRLLLLGASHMGVDELAADNNDEYNGANGDRGGSNAVDVGNDIGDLNKEFLGEFQQDCSTLLGGGVCAVVRWLSALPVGPRGVSRDTDTGEASIGDIGAGSARTTALGDSLGSVDNKDSRDRYEQKDDIFVRCVCDSSLGQIPYSQNMWPWTRPPSHPKDSDNRDDPDCLENTYPNALLAVDIDRKYGIRTIDGRAKAQSANRTNSEYLTVLAQGAGVGMKGVLGHLHELCDPLLHRGYWENSADDGINDSTARRQLQWAADNRLAQLCHLFFSLLHALALDLQSHCIAHPITSSASVSDHPRSCYSAVQSAVLLGLVRGLGDVEKKKDMTQSTSSPMDLKRLPVLQLHYLLYLSRIIHSAESAPKGIEARAATLAMLVHSLERASYTEGKESTRSPFQCLLRSSLFLCAGHQHVQGGSTSTTTATGTNSSRRTLFGVDFQPHFLSYLPDQQAASQLWCLELPLVCRNTSADSAQIDSSDRVADMLPLCMALVKDSCLYVLSAAVRVSCEHTYSSGSSVISSLSSTLFLSALDTIRTTSLDSQCVQLLRWCQNFTYQYHEFKYGHSHLWGVLGAKCVSICKTHIFSQQQKKGAGSTSGTLYKRPFFWPARAAALQTLQLLMRLSECVEWINFRAWLYPYIINITFKLNGSYGRVKSTSIPYLSISIEITSIPYLSIMNVQYMHRTNDDTRTSPPITSPHPQVRTVDEVLHAGLRGGKIEKR